MKTHRFGRTAVLGGLSLALTLLSACSANGSRLFDPNHETYALVYLTSGPKSGQGEKDKRSAMFAGHMRNIKRLADEGTLVVAGPFNKPTDKSWRGILVLAVRSVEEAKALAASDPGVQAGEFTPVVRLMRASPVLHKTMEFERELEQEPKNAPPRDPSQPPANIRAYVMVTAADREKLWDAIDRLSWRDRVVWAGEFVRSSIRRIETEPTTSDSEAVVVLDSTDPAEVRANLANAGEISIDGWWSTTSLLKLRTAKSN